MVWIGQMGINRLPGMCRSIVLLLATSTLLSAPVMATKYIEANAADRNVRFKTTCPNPGGSLKRSGGVRTFTLKHGQKGGCPTDRQARHSAPYWERTEVASTEFRKGGNYRFSVDVNFDPEAKSSQRTTFFQVHQYQKNTCKSCYPAVMIKTSNGEAISADILTRAGHHVGHSLGVSRSSIAGKWTTFTIEMGAAPGYNDIAIYVGGRKRYSGKVYVEPDGSIYLKSGIYRPGNTGKILPTDRLSIRKLQYEAQ